MARVPNCDQLLRSEFRHGRRDNADDSRCQREEGVAAQIGGGMVAVPRKMLLPKVEDTTTSLRLRTCRKKKLGALRNQW